MLKPVSRSTFPTRIPKRSGRLVSPAFVSPSTEQQHQIQMKKENSRSGVTRLSSSFSSFEMCTSKPVQRDAQSEITSNVWRNCPLSSRIPMSAEDRCGVGLCCLSQDAILTPPVCGSAHHACVLLPDCQSKGGSQAGARARVPLIGVSALGKSD